MIQRKQTLYMLLAVLLSVLTLCLPIGTFYAEGMRVATEYNLWLYTAQGTKDFTTCPLFIILLLSSVLGIYSIFAYHNRVAQARLCVFNIFLVIGWYIVFAVFSQVLGGGNISFEIEIGGGAPFIAIALYLLSYKAIWADEKLVRSADRIR